MGNTSTDNAGRVEKSDITMPDYDKYLRLLPTEIQHFIEFESTIPIDPKEAWEYKTYSFGVTWEYILQHITMFSESVHRQSFDGVHPGLDAPRRVW